MRSGANVSFISKLDPVMFKKYLLINTVALICVVMGFQFPMTTGICATILTLIGILVYRKATTTLHPAVANYFKKKPPYTINYKDGKYEVN